MAEIKYIKRVKDFIKDGKKARNVIRVGRAVENKVNSKTVAKQIKDVIEKKWKIKERSEE